MKRLLIAAFGVALLSASPAYALPPAPTRTLQSASDVLDDFAALPLQGIPASVLADAQGIAIIPRVIKAGFLLGGRGGHGVIVSRDRAGAWGGLTFVDLGGASIGFQAGVESADVVLVFKTRDSLDRVLAGRGKLTLGADAAIAAGPVGRQVEAGTDARLRAEIVSYSRSRGLFAGIALDGAALVYDRTANEAYRADARPEVQQLSAALLTRCARMSAPPVPVVPAPIAPVPVIPAVPAPAPMPQPLPMRPY